MNGWRTNDTIEMRAQIAELMARVKALEAREAIKDKKLMCVAKNQPYAHTHEQPE